MTFAGGSGNVFVNSAQVTDANFTNYLALIEGESSHGAVFWDVSGTNISGYVPANSMTNAGVVAAGTNNPSKVWKTDAAGIPGWRDDVGGAGGDSVTVNGVGIVDIDLDDATPAAPANAINVKWQKDGSSPGNVSAYLAFDPADFWLTNSVFGLWSLAASKLTGTIDDARIPTAITRDVEWDTSGEILAVLPD